MNCTHTGHLHCTHRRRERVAAGVSLLALFPAAHLLYPFLMRDEFPTCPFRMATGLPCPLCGLTRAIAAAAHGDFRQAFVLHPLWPGFALIIALLGSASIVDGLSGGNRAGSLTAFLQKRWRWFAAALVLFGICRIAAQAA